MDTSAYDKVIGDIKNIAEDAELRKICQFLNSLLRDQNSTLNDGHEEFQYSTYIEKLKIRKADVEQRLAQRMKKILEEYFARTEGDEILHLSRIDQGLFHKLQDLEIPGIFARRDGSTKEITFSNYDPDIADNDYEELDAFQEEDGDKKEQTGRMTVKDIMERFNNLIDSLKTFPDPVEQLELVGYERATRAIHFRIIPPEFTGNCKIQTFRVRLYEYNADDAPRKEEEVTLPLCRAEALEAGRFYYMTVQPGNEIGFQSECRKFFVRPIETARPCTELILQTSNQFMQVPEDPFLKIEQKGPELWSAAVKHDDTYKDRIIDFGISAASALLLENGELLECGKIVRFKATEYSDKNLPIESADDVIIGVTGLYSPMLSTPIVSVSCGLKFTLALSCNGEVFGWGENLHGQLGLGDLFARPFPTKIPGLPFIKTLRTCYQNAIALDLDDRVFVWGHLQGLFGVARSNEGLFIVPGDNDQNTPRELSESFGKIDQIACGNGFNAVSTKKGELFTFGVNKYGQLGFDYPNGLVLPHCDLPHKLFDSGVEEVQLSGSHTVVKKRQPNGKTSFYGFGKNNEQQIMRKIGQLQVREPVEIALGDKNVRRFWAINNATVFEFEDGQRETFGVPGPFESYLKGDVLVKMSHTGSGALLKYD